MAINATFKVQDVWYLYKYNDKSAHSCKKYIINQVFHMLRKNIFHLVLYEDCYFKEIVFNDISRLKEDYP